jgi:hypothetical protein
MTISSTMSEFNNWKRKYNKSNYFYKNIWNEVGHHQLDNLFFELASIYDRSSPSEREFIEKFFVVKPYPFVQAKKLKRLLQLVYFVRRISVLIHSSEQSNLVRTGLIVALIEGGKYDFRDTIVSLLILRYAAERNGVDFLGLLDRVIPLARPESRDVFLNVKNHSDTNMLLTVRRHGPPEWT